MNLELIFIRLSVQEMKKASLPKDIIYKDDEVVVTLQATVNNQIDKICQLSPEMVEEMVRIKKEHPGPERDWKKMTMKKNNQGKKGHLSSQEPGKEKLNPKKRRKTGNRERHLQQERD